LTITAQSLGGKQVNKLKVIIASGFVIGAVALLASQSVALPPFVARARKFGANDCRFCHVNVEGGAGYNARGNWLIDEKARRNADAVDPEWLANYKPAKKGKK
jgi:hypothetical protein